MSEFSIRDGSLQKVFICAWEGTMKGSTSTYAMNFFLSQMNITVLPPLFSKRHDLQSKVGAPFIESK